MRLSEVKKDQTFYECERGCNIKVQALADPVDTGEGHSLQVNIIGEVTGRGIVIKERNDVTDYYECYEPGAYGLRLYDFPQYW